jgi:hypothetical protein
MNTKSLERDFKGMAELLFPCQVLFDRKPEVTD